jgi:hypothetical protein
MKRIYIDPFEVTDGVKHLYTQPTNFFNPASLDSKIRFALEHMQILSILIRISITKGINYAKS